MTPFVDQLQARSVPQDADTRLATESYDSDRSTLLVKPKSGGRCACVQIMELG